MSDENIDVLAVIERAEFEQRDWGDDNLADTFRLALDAVAELIEAAKAATEMVMHDGNSSKAACERLGAAWRACVAANS